MYKHLLFAALLVPVAAFADSPRRVLTVPALTGRLVLTYPPSTLEPTAPPKALSPVTPPGLELKLSPPIAPIQKAPPGVLLVPPTKLPGTGAPLSIPAPPAPVSPPQPQSSARLLVFTPDDRAATKTFHPLLTPGTEVNVILASPNVRIVGH